MTDSYPKSNGNFTAAQWRGVFDGQTGIIDSDGSADTSFDLQLSTIDNKATVSGGKVHYRGFVCDNNSADPASDDLPAATTDPLTYVVGIMYDQPNEKTQPLFPWFGLKTAIGTNTPVGGSFWTAFEVTRSAGQTLAQATVVDKRSFLGPQLVVNAPSALPSDAPVGTRAFDGTDQWIRVRNSSKTGAEWSNLTNPAWTVIPLDPSYKNADSTWGTDTTPRVRVRQGQLEVVGMVSPKTSYFPPGEGVVVGTLPVGLRPIGRPVSLTVATTFEFTGAPPLCRLDIRKDGTLTITAPSGTNVQKYWASLELSVPLRNS